MREVGLRRPRPLQGVWLLGAALVAAAALAPAGAGAPSQQTSASISGQADWISNNHINVYVTVQGSGGCCGFLNVNVSQATPFGGANGMGGTQIFCGGQRQTYAVNVFGGGGFPGFQLGEALATAQAFCPSPFPPGSDSKTIRITKP
jgi:hypothetical protein